MHSLRNASLAACHQMHTRAVRPGIPQPFLHCRIPPVSPFAMSVSYSRTTSSARAGRSRGPSLLLALLPDSWRRCVRAKRASASAARNRLRCCGWAGVGQRQAGVSRWAWHELSKEVPQGCQECLAGECRHVVATRGVKFQESGCAAAPYRGGCGLWQPPRNMEQPKQVAVPQALTAGGWVCAAGR